MSEMASVGCLGFPTAFDQSRKKRPRVMGRERGCALGGPAAAAAGEEGPTCSASRGGGPGPSTPAQFSHQFAGVLGLNPLITAETKLVEFFLLTLKTTHPSTVSVVSLSDLTSVDCGCFCFSFAGLG